MATRFAIARSSVFVCLALSLASAEGTQRSVVVPLESGWRFFQGDLKGAQDPDFDDAYWAVANLPHDWRIEQPLEARRAGAVGWYRKHFLLPGEYGGQRLFIQFDGVMGIADTWINGNYLGQHVDSYRGFQYDLTPYLYKNDRQMNVLAVRVASSGPSPAGTYTGAGLYRHVRVVITGPVHFVNWSTTVQAPAASDGASFARIATTVVNQSPNSRGVSIEYLIQDPGQRTITTVETPVRDMASKESLDFRQNLSVPNPQWWSPDDPKLYTATVSLKADGTTLDKETVPFAFRRQARSGQELHGVTLYQDGGALGMAVPLGIWQRRLGLLKSIGVNAVHMAGGPPAPEVLDLCDRLGLLVVEDDNPKLPNAFEPLGEASPAPALFDRTGRPEPLSFRLKSQWLHTPVAQTRHEVGKPVRVALSADQSTLSMRWDDLVVLTATIVDEHGTPVPGASDRITFSGRGPAYIAAVDNGDPAGRGPFMGADCKAFHGRCIAILKARAPEGKLTMNAEAAGLKPSTITLEVETPAPRR